MINQIGGHLGIYVDIIFMIFICKKKRKEKGKKMDESLDTCEYCLV
jgi:hypothetical protein